MSMHPSFELDLSGVRRFPELAADYDDENDNVASLLFDLANAIEEAGGKFRVGGFGQDRWPIVIGRDLSLFLEQLPGALAALDAGAPFSIDFFEQGMTRFISFQAGQNRMLLARCTSYDESWAPNPAEVSIEADQLAAQLTDIQKQLRQFVEENSPTVASHPWFREWIA